MHSVAPAMYLYDKHSPTGAVVLVTCLCLLGVSFLQCSCCKEVLHCAGALSLCASVTDGDVGIWCTVSSCSQQISHQGQSQHRALSNESLPCPVHAETVETVHLLQNGYQVCQLNIKYVQCIATSFPILHRL